MSCTRHSNSFAGDSEGSNSIAHQNVILRLNRGPHGKAEFKSFHHSTTTAPCNKRVRVLEGVLHVILLVLNAWVFLNIMKQQTSSERGCSPE
mmetsp:Transcript_1881/g.5196  ORF Transcript_1881/g.5196 Transcript_1881/m.5196 type:complete len:92 (+) Transcript_1881:1128-1403(+)